MVIMMNKFLEKFANDNYILEFCDNDQIHKFCDDDKDQIRNSTMMIMMIKFRYLADDWNIKFHNDH